MTVLAVRQMGFPWETRDPFLFCAHHLDRYPAGNEAMAPEDSLTGRVLGNDFSRKDGWSMYHGTKVPGFPQHPHRGFETITLARQGFVDHSDSMGATARFGQGDVQWMTAGQGVVHSEMFPLRDPNGPNTLEIFQIWLNLPRKGKLCEPYFSMFWSEQVPRLEFPGAGDTPVTVTVIAGELDDAKPPSPPPDSWAADPANHVAVWMIRLPAGAGWTLPAAAPGLNRTLYFYEGDQLTVDGQVIGNYNAVDLDSARDVPLTAGPGDCELVMLQGRPINEPVFQHGPFVMNTREEIQETIVEYQRTQFGGWPWPDHGPVHPRDQDRFAIHGDGREESP